MKQLNEKLFLISIMKYLNYNPDSANYNLYEQFIDLLVEEGGDDSFAHLNHFNVAFEFSKFVTQYHIKQYDNDIDTLVIYLDIKPQIQF